MDRIFMFKFFGRFFVSSFRDFFSVYCVLCLFFFGLSYIFEISRPNLGASRSREQEP